MPSIFGSLQPKFVINAGTVDEATLYFDHFLLKTDEPEQIKIVHEDEIDHTRFITYKGSLWTFEGVDHLYKYDNPGNKWSELKSFEHKKGILYPHRDGSPFYNPYGDPAEFYFDFLKPFLKTQRPARDAVMVRFISHTVVSHTQNPVVNLEGVKDDLGSIIKDDNGVTLT